MFSGGIDITKIKSDNANAICGGGSNDAKVQDEVCRDSENAQIDAVVSEIGDDAVKAAMFENALRLRQFSALDACTAISRWSYRGGLAKPQIKKCTVKTQKTGLDPEDKTGKSKAYPLIYYTKDGARVANFYTTDEWFSAAKTAIQQGATIVGENSYAVPQSVLDKMNEAAGAGVDAVHKPYIRLYRLGTALAPEKSGELKKFIDDKDVAEVNTLPDAEAAKLTVDVIKLLSGIGEAGKWDVQAPDALFTDFDPAQISQAMALRQLYEQAILYYFTKKPVQDQLKGLDAAGKKAFIEAALPELAKKVNEAAKAKIAEYAGVDFATAKDDARLPALEKSVVIVVTDNNDTHQPDAVMLRLRETRLPVEYSDGLGTLNFTEREVYERIWIRINKQVRDVNKTNAFVDGVRESVSSSAVNEFAKILFGDSGLNAAVADSSQVTFDADSKLLNVDPLDDTVKVLSFEEEHGHQIQPKLRELILAAKASGAKDATDEDIMDAIDRAFIDFKEARRKAGGEDYAGVDADQEALLHMTLSGAEVKDGQVVVTLVPGEAKKEDEDKSFGPSKVLKKDGKKTEKLETHGSVRLTLGGVFAEENVTKPDGEDSDNDNKSFSFDGSLNWGKHNYLGAGDDKKETSAFGVTLATSAVSSPGMTLPQGDGNTALASPGKVAGKYSYTIDEIAGFWNVLLSDPEAKAAEGKGLWDVVLKTTFGATSNDVTGNGLFGAKSTLAAEYGHKNESYDGSTVTAKLGFGTNLTMGHDNAANLADNDMGGYSFFGSLGGAIAFVPEFVLALTGEYGLGDGTYESPTGEKLAGYYKTDLWQIKGGISGKLLRSDAKGKAKDKEEGEAEKKKEDTPPTSVGYELTGKYTSATEGDVTGYGAGLMFSFNGYMGAFTPSVGLAYDLTGSQAVDRTPSGGTGGGLGGGAAGTEGRMGSVSEEQGFDAWTAKAKGVYKFDNGWAADVAANLSWQSRLLKMAESRDDSTQTVGSLIFGIGYEH